MSELRRLVGAADLRIPCTHPQSPDHTGLMAIRFTAQGDTREECVEGLELLVAAGLVPTMLPVQVRTDGWMARAVPAARMQDATTAPQPKA